MHSSPALKGVGIPALIIERMIMPDEIADMVVAVIKSDAMTGEIVMIDGGISLKTV